MSDDEQTPQERVEFLTGWSPEAADAFRDLAADSGFELDYTPDSLAEVERFISALPGRKGKPKKEYHDLAGTTGAYVAEVILRNIGGHWAYEAEFDAAGIRLPWGTLVFPLHKSRKRYEDGPGDDFVSYYDVLVAEEPK